MVETSQPEVKIEALPKQARFRDIVAEGFESLVDMKQIVQQNEARRAAQEAEAKASEEIVKQTLYQESLKVQESLKNLQAQLSMINFDSFFGGTSSQNALPTIEAIEAGDAKQEAGSKQAGSTANLPKSRRDLPPLQKPASSSRVLMKKTIVEDGEAKNYHVDYTGKMIYYDNQK